MALKDDLKVSLANTISLYLRAHGYHWNVEGSDFREYHGLFEEIYSDLYGAVDPIAENIRKLQDYAPYRLERLVEFRTISEDTVGTDPRSMSNDLLHALEEYITHLNVCFKAAVKEDQQGIANFLSERIDSSQKWCWFLRASLH
jgi:starvation-inducible DNA-binding protein